MPPTPSCIPHLIVVPVASQPLQSNITLFEVKLPCHFHSVNGKTDASQPQEKEQ